MSLRVVGFWGLALVLLIYLFVLQIWAIWPFTIDDMYITLRYANHWAEGHGILWNIQDAPVEGYSNFSFVALAALSIFWGLDPVITLKVAGVVGLFFTCVYMYLISRIWFKPQFAIMPVLTLLVYKGQIIWTASGLETTVYEALICAAFYYGFRGLGYRLHPLTLGRAQPVTMFFCGLLLALAGMTRPEAPLFMLLWSLALISNKATFNTKTFWSFALGLGILYIPYFAWRLLYFGYLFPNPVYCKGFFSENAEQLDLNYLKLVLPLVIFLIPLIVLMRDRRVLLLLAPSVLYLLALYGADPIVAFDNRLFLTAFALLLPMAFLGFSVLWGCVIDPQNKTFDVIVLLSWALWIGLCIPKMSLQDYAFFTTAPIKGERLRAKVADWIEHNSTNKSRVVLGDCGMIPYLTKVSYVDSYCLNNKEMAHFPARTRYQRFCDNVLTQFPDLIVLTSLHEVGKVIYTPSDRCLIFKLKSDNNYRLKKVFSAKTEGSVYQYEIFSKEVLR